MGEKMSEESNFTNKLYCGFRIGDDEFGIPVLDVQEVIKPQPVTPIPLSQDYVKGLINLRGQIVTLLSLRQLFAYDNDNDDIKTYMNIIIKGREGFFSLVVDQVTDIIEIDERYLEASPETLNSSLKDYVKQVYKKKNGLIILLNIEKLLDLNFIESKVAPSPTV
jgi:purine-binding chemotaxis protein CheW